MTFEFPNSKKNSFCRNYMRKYGKFITPFDGCMPTCISTLKNILLLRINLHFVVFSIRPYHLWSSVMIMTWLTLIGPKLDGFQSSDFFDFAISFCKNILFQKLVGGLMYPFSDGCIQEVPKFRDFRIRDPHYFMIGFQARFRLKKGTFEKLWTQFGI